MIVRSVTATLIAQGAGRFTDWIYMSLVISISADILIDSVCIALAMHSFDAQYQRICRPCDSWCKACCSRLAKASRRKAESDLVAAVSMDQTAGGTTGGTERGAAKGTLTAVGSSAGSSTSSVEMVVKSGGGNVAIIH